MGPVSVMSGADMVNHTTKHRTGPIVAEHAALFTGNAVSSHGEIKKGGR